MLQRTKRYDQKKRNRPVAVAHIAIKAPEIFYDRTNAEATIAELNSDIDDDWVYEIEEVPGNRAGLVRIRITDEDGEFVAYAGF